MFQTSFIKLSYVLATALVFLQSVKPAPLKLIDRRTLKNNDDEIRKFLEVLEKSPCQGHKRVWFPIEGRNIVFKTNGNHVIPLKKKIQEVPKPLKHQLTNWTVFKTFYDPSLLMLGVRTETEGEYKFLYWENGSLHMSSSECVNSQASRKVFILKEETLVHAITKGVPFCNRKSCSIRDARRVVIK